MGTEHRRRVRCYQRGRCSLTNPELSVWQVVASGYDEQKEESVQPPTILQGGLGWAEHCGMVPSSDSTLLPGQDAARIILLDSVLRSTLSEPVPLSDPITRSSDLIYSH